MSKLFRKPVCPPTMHCNVEPTSCSNLAQRTLVTTATSGQLPALAHSATSSLHPLHQEGVGSCLWGGRRCQLSPLSTWTDPPLLLLLHHLIQHLLPGRDPATMTVRLTYTAESAESAMFSAKNTLAVTVMVKMVLKSIFIVQCAVAEEAWNITIAS